MSFIRKILLISFAVCWEGYFAFGIALPSNNLILYKYEGNFYPVYATEHPQSVQGYPSRPVITPVQLSQQIYHEYPEEEPVPLVAAQVQPLNSDPTGLLLLSKPAVDTSQQEVPSRADSITRQYHDIFLKLKSPHELVFGHVLNWPEAAEKKVEKRTRNNYKGQVIWADRKGGYGEHHWDLAQGAL